MRIRPLPALALATALLAAPAWSADVRYVRDTLLVNLRATADPASETLKFLRTGESLEVLTEEGEYLKVRDSAGNLGWVPRPYLVGEPPAALLLGAAQTEAEKLRGENEALKAEFGRVREATSQKSRSAGRDAESAQAQAASLALRLAETERQYAKLLDASGRAVEIAAERDRLAAENAALAGEAESLRAQASGEKSTEAVKWFLAGALAILLGWWLGMLSARKKRPQPFR